MDDDLVFAEDDDEEEEEGREGGASPLLPPWKVLIVDDDRDVHALTRMVLKNFHFDSRPLEILSGYSGEDARRLMEIHPDVAVIFLDVVMETEHAGLEAVWVIREQLKNRLVRIILRTGQPGQAPEQDVINSYDINDYKEKTELTEQKLMTTVTASLRAYRDLLTMEQGNRGLEKILEATSTLFESCSMVTWATGVLTQLAAILGGNEGATAMRRQSSGFAALRSGENGAYVLYAGTGLYQGKIGQPLLEVVSPEQACDVPKVGAVQQMVYREESFLCFFKGRGDLHTILFFDGGQPLDEVDRTLFEVFVGNAGLALSAMERNQETLDTQKDVTFMLGALIEARSSEIGHHVMRVAYGARLMAERLALSEEDAALLWLAAPLHDLGKIAVPDHILLKPGKLEPEEWRVMQDHAHIGYQILRQSEKEILKAAATVAAQHHERWDGQGYPLGLQGEEIPVFSRIIALVDVFDALSHRRCYQEAWEREQVLDFIRKERGKQFDPKLVDILMENLDDFYRIQEKYADAGSVVEVSESC